MFDEQLGTIEDGVSKPVPNAYDDVPNQALKVRLAEQQYSVPTAQMATAIMRHGCIC
jgi:hypothetical protein